MDGTVKLDFGKTRPIDSPIVLDFGKTRSLDGEGDETQFTTNPKKEGTYEMLSGDGDVIAVPFSKVDDASKAGYILKGASEQRYKKDYEAIHPTWSDRLLRMDTESEKFRKKHPYLAHLSNLGGGVLSGAESLLRHPIQSTEQGIQQAGEASVAAQTTPEGFPMPPIIGSKSGEEANRANRDASESALAHQEEIGKQMVAHPAYTAGQLVGGALVGEAAGEALPKAIGGVKDKIGTAASGTAKEIFGVRPHVAEELVTKTMEDNAEASTEAAKENARRAEKHLDAVRDALHETKGSELIHEREEDLKQAEIDAKHARDVADVEEHNRKVTRRYAGKVQRVNEENRAAEQVLELRNKKADELAEKTLAHYDLEDQREVEAKKMADDAWRPWHDKTDNIPVAQSEIFDDLKKKGVLTPQVEDNLRFIEAPASSEPPESQYAVVRKSIMQNQGETRPYEDLSPAKQQAYDQMTQDAGVYPETIDLTPDGASTTVKKLHEAHSIIQAKIRSGAYDGVILGRMKRVASTLGRIIEDKSRDAGSYEDLEKGRAATRRFKEAFGKAAPRPRTMVAIREAWLNPESDRARAIEENLDKSAKIDPNLAESARRIRELRDEVRKMPNEDTLRKRLRKPPPPPSLEHEQALLRLRRMPEHPGNAMYNAAFQRAPLAEGKPRAEVPERPPEVTPEIKQIGEEELTEANRKQYEKTIRALRSRGIWYGAALPWLWVAREVMNLKLGDAAVKAIGAGVSTIGTVLSVTKLADTLEDNPSIRDWVARPSPAELRELDRLPAPQRKSVADGLGRVIRTSNREGFHVSPALTAWVVATEGKEARANKTALEKAP